MGSGKASNAVLTIARAKFGRRIPFEDFLKMAAFSGVSQVAEYLKGTRFSEEMQKSGGAVWRRGSLEAVLKKQSMADIYALCGFEKKIGSPVFRLYMMEVEADEIIRFVRFLSAGKPEEYIYTVPDSVRDMVSMDLIALSQVKTDEELVMFLEESEEYRPVAQTIRNAKNGHVNLTLLETNLDRLVYQKSMKIIRRHFSGNELEQLRFLIRLRAETADLEAVYRAKRFFGESPDMVRTLLVGDGALLKKSQFEDLVHARDAETFCGILRGTAYGKYMPPDRLPDDFSFLAQVLLKRAVHCIHFSGCPAAVVYAYIIYLSLERRNIVHIIEGVRYGLSSEEIVKTLHILQQEVE